MIDKNKPNISFDLNTGYSLEFISPCGTKRFLIWKEDDETGWAFVKISNREGIQASEKDSESSSGNLDPELFECMAKYFDDDYDVRKMDEALK